MDLEERCHSQSSHYSQHRSHGNSRLHAQTRPPSQTRRPLHSVTRNTALLRSPGPLESMLKTTTETGDIGVFSIRPTPPSMTYHHPPRPRPNFGDAGLLPRPHSRGVDEGSMQDDRRALPSYRDTTSEILSLYGSSTQPSFPRSFSPSVDDGQRSYSLTTCGSRRLPSQKSSYTSPSVSSAGGLQRPRSPFPYPTRLRRPGIRPASPAVTDHGNFDYHKGVELDKVSYRNVHGSHKPAYYTSPRLPPPLSMRPEFNRSTSSLPSRVSPGIYYPGFGPSRSRTPNSTFHNRPRSPRRQQDSSDQSVRSASLTSIVEMYQEPIPPSRTRPILRSAGSFYYDYSEDFEPGSGQEFGYMPLLCLVPQQMKSSRRPMILGEGSQGRIEVADTVPEAQILEEGKDGSNGNPVNGAQNKKECLPPDALDIFDHPNSSPFQEIGAESISLDAHTPRGNGKNNVKTTSYADDVSSHPVLPPSQEVVARGIHGLPPESGPSSERLSDLSWCTEWQPFKPRIRDSDETGAPKERGYQSSHPTCDPKSNLTPLKSSVAIVPFDSWPDSNAMDKSDKKTVTSTVFDNQKPNQLTEDQPGPHSRSQNSLSQVQSNCTKRTTKNSLGRHRRNLATTDIKPPLISDDEQLNLPITRADTPIISPSPISPTQQLKLTKSIPQLMKSLPPLPDEAYKLSESPHGSTSTEPEISTRLLFTSPTKSLVTFKCEENPSFLAPRTLFDEDDKEEPKARSSKFKIRAKTSRSLNPREQRNHKSEVGSAEKLMDHKRPRLRLKISRSQLNRGKPIQDGTVFHSPGLKLCSSASELRSNSREEFFEDHCGLYEYGSMGKPRTGLSRGGLIAIHEASGLDTSPMPSDQFDIPYPSSRENKDRPELPGGYEQGHGLGSVQKSVFSTDSTSNRRGLRQKVSLLRLRMAGPPAPISEPKKRRLCSSTSESHERSSLPAMASYKGLGGRSRTEIHQKAKAGPSQSKKRVRRVRRWAFEAKRVVRSLRRTFDRSTHSSG